jgi:hypothetical protein
MPDETQNQVPPPEAAPLPPPPLVPPPSPAPNILRASEQVGLRVSLIPAEEMDRNDPRHGFRLFLIIVIIFAIVLGGILGTLWFFVNSNLQTVSLLNIQTAELDKSSKALAPSVKEAKNTQARLKVLATILPQHRTGLKILTFLENHTFPEVAYSSLAVSENGTVNLSAKATSFEVYASQVAEFRAQSEVKSVIASGLSPQWGDKNVLDSVTFNLTIAFDPLIFTNNEPSK